MYSKIIKDNRGSALLVALLVMGVLISVSLVLSNLIFREVRIVRGVLESGRAYYAAESGIEVSLYKIKNNLPGWSTTAADGEEVVYKTLKIDEDVESFGEYKVNNRCNAYPCFDEDFDKDSVADVREFYDTLELNESITIPLFVVNDEGQEVAVEDFTVEFFVGFTPEEHFGDAIKEQFKGKDIGSWDVLRWKIFGVRTDGQGTEAISDFTAVSKGSSPMGPSWFGTISCDGQEGRYTDKINCPIYLSGGVPVAVEYDNDLEASVITGGCTNQQAREHYVYGADRRVDQNLGDISQCYPIKNFMVGGTDPHKLNYLTLTNLMNPAVFKEELDEKEMSKIYFRVEFFGPGESKNTVREFADVTANGYSGDSKKSINVKLQKGSFMPVFNFSLYSTYKAEKGFDYYYGEREDEQTL